MASSSPDAVRYARLWDEHGQRIYRFCYRRTADPELAEDLTSIVFLEAWRNREKAGQLSDAQDEMLPWLYGIAANVVRNQWRTRRRHRAALARVPRPRAEDEIEDDVASAVVERVDGQARMAHLLARLQTLPKIEQDVLSLCTWEDLTPQEAATALGIPEATARTRLHRARKRLRALEDATEGAALGDVPRIEGEGSS